MKNLLLVIGFLFAFTASAETVSYTATAHNGAAQSANAKWTAIDGTDTAQALKVSNYKEKSVQVTGTFAGATVILQGSNDNSTWFTLNDVANASLTCTAACLKAVEQMTTYIRPYVSGTASASITVDMHLKSK